MAYTGTHDNETINGWFTCIQKKERQLARDYLCDHYTPDEELNWSFISLIMRSRANLCVVPMQDYLGYDNSCRMNTPSTVGENWQWRLKEGELTDELQKNIHEGETVFFSLQIFYNSIMMIPESKEVCLIRADFDLLSIPKNCQRRIFWLIKSSDGKG